MTGTLLIGPTKSEIVQVFSQIYAENTWNTAGTSGPGSSIESTSEYRDFLQSILTRYSVGNLLDVGCGVWEHMNEVSLLGIQYLGLDPVDAVVEANMRRGLSENIRFQCGTLDDVKNLQSYDAAIVKDVFQHLPGHLILYMLEQLKDVPLLIITNDYEDGGNKSCLLGDARGLDLEALPFSLKAAERLDFSSSPFAKRTIVVLNGVSAASPELNTSSCVPAG